MSHNLECLCYEGKNAKGQIQTVPYAYIGRDSTEEIQAKADALRSQGKINVRALSWADYEAIELEESKISLNLNVPQKIEAQEFKDHFNALVPVAWDKSEYTEIFRTSEAYTSNIYAFYVRLGKGEEAKYFEVNAQSSTPKSEILGFCEAIQ